MSRRPINLMSLFQRAGPRARPISFFLTFFFAFQSLFSFYFFITRIALASRIRYGDKAGRFSFSNLKYFVSRPQMPRAERVYIVDVVVWRLAGLSQRLRRRGHKLRLPVRHTHLVHHNRRGSAPRLRRAHTSDCLRKVLPAQMQREEENQSPIRSEFEHEQPSPRQSYALERKISNPGCWYFRAQRTHLCYDAEVRDDRQIHGIEVFFRVEIRSERRQVQHVGQQVWGEVLEGLGPPIWGYSGEVRIPAPQQHDRFEVRQFEGRVRALDGGHVHRGQRQFLLTRAWSCGNHGVADVIVHAYTTIYKIY